MRYQNDIPCTSWFNQETPILNLTTTWVYEQNQKLMISVSILRKDNNSFVEHLLLLVHVK